MGENFFFIFFWDIFGRLEYNNYICKQETINKMTPKEYEDWKKSRVIEDERAMAHIANVRASCKRLGLSPSQLLQSKEINYMDELKK